MQKISSIAYGIGQGVKNIRRNKMFSLASIGTMAACLFLFGVFYFVLVNFQHIVKSAETNVGVTVFFEEGISEEKIQEIGDSISLRAEVAELHYLSADEAWERYKKESLNPELAKTFGNDNPLEDSASYTVYLNDVSMQDSLVKYIWTLEGVRKVNSKEELADKLSGFNTGVTFVTAAIIVILLCVAAFLISTTVTVGISVRKHEISIMKLIGATDSFIRVPYIVEGILIGLVGAGVPLGVLYVLYSRIVKYAEVQLEGLLMDISLLDSGEIFATLIPISLLIGLGIGIFGSCLTLRKQLRKIELN